MATATVVEVEVDVASETPRMRALRAAGFSLGTPESAAEAVSISKKSHHDRVAGSLVFEPVVNNVKPAVGALCCPRCDNLTTSAFLNNNEKIGYCPGCRYAMPLPITAA